MGSRSARWKGVAALILVAAVGLASRVQAVDNDVGSAGGSPPGGREGTETTGPPEVDPGAVAGQPDALQPSYSQWLRVAGSTLRPRRDDVSYANSSQGGCLYATSGSTSTWFNLSAELPDGALVKYVRIYADDSSAAANCAAYFTVYDLYGNVVEEHGVSSSGSGGPNYWTTDELFVVVDYASNSYVLNWRPNVIGSEMQLCGFRLYYYLEKIFSHGFEAGGTSGWSAVIQ